MNTQVISHNPTATETVRLLTPRQAAELLQVSARTVTRLCEGGQIKAVRIGGQWRINRAALLQAVGLN